MKVPPYVASSFESFCTTYYGGGNCLADYVAAWMIEGDGMKACSGNREMFLEAVVFIIADWQNDPGVLDCDVNLSSDEPVIAPRSATSVLGQAWIEHPILDPNWFERVKRQKRS